MDLTEACSAPQTVADRLERAIRKGEFKPNDAIPSERVLAENWGLSRPIIREGISMLVAKGILTRRHGRGSFVNDIEAQLGNSIWGDMSRRHPNIQGDLLEFRHMLERRCAELAAERHTAQDRRRLEEAEAAVYLAFCGDDKQKQMEADIALHHSIADATKNPVYGYLMRSMHRVLLDHMQLTLVGHAANQELLAQIQQQHRSLIQAILARDAQSAGEIAAGHIEFVSVRMNHIKPPREPRRR
ncbi:MAG TPA: FadR/GntR family transcriptional regulator [Solimonas sp.]|nr:FadR/GntR family transcriptional regulator [Solimonas sp.]